MDELQPWQLLSLQDHFEVRSMPVVCVNGMTELLIFGGSSPDGSLLSDMHILNTKTNDFNLVSDDFGAKVIN